MAATSDIRLESGYSQTTGTLPATQSMPPKSLQKVICSATSNNMAQAHVSADANHGIKDKYNESTEKWYCDSKRKDQWIPCRRSWLRSFEHVLLGPPRRIYRSMGNACIELAVLQS